MKPLPRCLPLTTLVLALGLLSLVSACPEPPPPQEGEGEGERDPCSNPPDGALCVVAGAYDAGGETHDIDALLFDRDEVGLASYRDCVSVGACSAPPTDGSCNFGDPSKDGNPVNCLSWHDANDYCTWAGKRLPTEWEWQWAARGRDEGRRYPWGSALPDETLACWASGGTGPWTCPPDEHSPEGDSRDGLRDMAGNVAEWTASWFDAGQTQRVYRGGSFGSGELELQVYERTPLEPTSLNGGTGARCVSDLQ